MQMLAGITNLDKLQILSKMIDDCLVILDTPTLCAAFRPYASIDQAEWTRAIA